MRRDGEDVFALRDRPKVRRKLDFGKQVGNVAGNGGRGWNEDFDGMFYGPTRPRGHSPVVVVMKKGSYVAPVVWEESSEKMIIGYANCRIK